MNIFLDCGTHLCGGLLNFYNNKLIDDSYIIHTFEANPACNINERIKKIPLNIVPHNVAVWIKDGTVLFNQEHHQKCHTGSDRDGWASSVDGIGFNYHGYEDKIEIPSIDFSKFVSNLPCDANIICKMDIEGSEFSVLRHMIQENTITKIKELYVEFHERFMPSESPETKQKLISDISNLGVKIHNWT